VRNDLLMYDSQFFNCFWQPRLRTLSITTSALKMEDASPDLSSDSSNAQGIPILLLTSHAHSPPLTPPPKLKYDLRGVENPPKAIRDAYTGVSKRLRDHMLSHDAFIALLDQAEADIRSAMDTLLRKSGGAETEVNGPEASVSGSDGEEVVLSVGAFCARGHHRSVAFVEELARRKCPSKWEVQIVHRDLGRHRSSGSSQRGRKSGGGKGGFDLIHGADD
jgi:hypothetical protein